MLRVTLQPPTPSSTLLPNHSHSFCATIGNPAAPDSVFSNAELKLSRIRVFGFDYDYTLASYTREIQPLIYSLAKHHLVNELGYPDSVLDLQYNPHFAIRGLHFDTKLGHMMKLDYLFNIQPDAIFFGHEPLSPKDVISAYGSYHLSRSYVEQSCRQMVDVFCLPEAGLLADVIEFMKSKKISFDPRYIYEDVRKSIDIIHRNGQLHRAIVEDLKSYLRSTDNLVPLLLRLRKAGRKTFLLTNSPYSFVDAGMQYLTNNNLPASISHWTDLFDLVLTSSKKPEFFMTDTPFRKVDVDVTNPSSKIRYTWDAVDTLHQSAVYAEGSLNHLRKLTGWTGETVLYFGDHVLADLKEPALIGGWSTGVIIHELEREIRIMNSGQYRQDLVELLACHKLLAEYQLNHLTGPAVEWLNDYRRDLKKSLKVCFNQNFGSLHRTYRHQSMFCHQMLRFANIYTSKIDNLMNYPLDFTFHPDRFTLPHDARVVLHDQDPTLY